MALNHKGIGIMLGLDFLFLYGIIMLYTYLGIPETWLNVLIIMSFIAFNMYILIQSLNYLDTQDNNMAVPIVAIVITSICLFIIVAIVIALIIAIIKGIKSEGG